MWVAPLPHRMSRVTAAPGLGGLLSLLTLAAGAALAPSAAAQQGTDPVTAEVLFQEARALLQAGKLDQACPKFIESQRLDPATGTLLAVATCHEREGKLATAWSEFTKAVGRARQERSDERVDLAQRRAEDLQPQLSTLSISVPDELARLPGLVIQRDGLAIGESTWNRALPIDGGSHALKVSAPGYETVALAVSVGVSSDHASVTLPMLQPVRATTLEPALLDSGPRGAPPAPGSLTPLRALGLGMGAAGVGGLVLGGAFLTGALIKKGNSADHCDGNACDARGVSLRDKATDWGNVATIAGITGAVLTGAGVSLYFFTGNDAEAPEAQLALSFSALPGGAATRLDVEF
jgi:hypothetical protein